MVEGGVAFPQARAGGRSDFLSHPRNFTTKEVCTMPQAASLAFWASYPTTVFVVSSASCIRACMVVCRFD